MGLIQLVYSSSAIKLMNNQELLEILQTSHRNNARDDISGLLLYKEGTFMQVLEGPEEAVLALYAKIERDMRHKNAQILVNVPIHERMFADWSMAFENMDGMNAKDYPGLVDFLDEPLTSESYKSRPNRVMILLRTFRELM